MTEQPERSHRVRHAVVWLGGLAALVQMSVFTFPVAAASWRREPWVRDLVAGHFPAIVGLPSAALAAFLIIAAFEARFDRIKMRLGTHQTGLVSCRWRPGVVPTIAVNAVMKPLGFAQPQAWATRVVSWPSASRTSAWWTRSWVRHS